MSLENNKIKSIQVKCAPFDKEIEVPTSKSYSNRVLILSSLNPKTITIKGLSKSSDVVALKNCLVQLGVTFLETQKNQVEVEGFFPECEILSKEPIYLEAGDGGTTNRFLIALLARGKNTYRVFSTGNISKRPVEELLEGLTQLGATANIIEEEGRVGIEIEGPIDGIKDIEVLNIDSSRSTQFASALAMCLWDQKTQVNLLNSNGSRDYFKMTQYLIEELNHGKSLFEVPVDFSSLSYPLALAAFEGTLLVKNCHSIDSFQPDSFLLNLFERAGLPYKIDEKGLLISGRHTFNSFELDCAPFPDLVPTLVFLAAYSQSSCILNNIGSLKYKETDRIEEIRKVLDFFDVKHEITGESLIVFPKTDLSPFIRFKAPPDHRIIMMTFLFMRMNSGGEIENYNHVEKSFPDFFKIMT